MDMLKILDCNSFPVDLMQTIKRNRKETIAEIQNNTAAPVTVKEVEACSFQFGELGFSLEAEVYAEGYQMLHQLRTKLKDISPNVPSMDKDHYKLPQNEGFYTAYNYVYLEEQGRVWLVGATSCHSYRTEIRISTKELRVVQVLENRTVESAASLKLESYAVIEGPDRNAVLDEFAQYIDMNHPKKGFKEVPDGWCSWYCYGPLVTEGAIKKNLRFAKDKLPQLKYIQIDDGYQPHMGDWLLQTKKFRTKMQDICLNIAREGFEPAMWVAPFIGSEKSQLFKNHPDWFVKDENGAPLSAEKVTFKGWRDAPWYFLDPTHPEAIRYLKQVFGIMKHDWHVNYFKLDANSWGALPFGARFQKNVTSVEAYRSGMEALWLATGPDTYLLGCNAPLWPSLGVVNGMRVTNDVGRNIGTITGISKQCFYRNWMHTRLWINDPDCLVQVGIKQGILDSLLRKKTEKRDGDKNMYRYAAAFIRASGGMVLSGDMLFALSDYDRELLLKIISLPRIAAGFNSDFSVGTIEYKSTKEVLLFNDSDSGKVFTVEGGGEVTDMFKDLSLGKMMRIQATVPAKDAAWYKITF